MSDRTIFPAHVVEETDGTFSVNTSISYERGFKRQKHAQMFVDTWGIEDKRKEY